MKNTNKSLSFIFITWRILINLSYIVGIVLIINATTLFSSNHDFQLKIDEKQARIDTLTYNIGRGDLNISLATFADLKAMICLIQARFFIFIGALTLLCF